MEKENVIELIGDPLFRGMLINEENNTRQNYSWTGDNKSRFGFAWLDIEIEFQNNKVNKIIIRWMHD
jgi:hypothetical protein